MSEPAQTSLRLEPIAGPPIDPVDLPAPGPHRIGRASTSDIQLDFGTVSRRQAIIVLQDNQWLIMDQTSRHGTYVNGVRLEPGEPIPITPGDLIRLGPWTFRVRDPGSAMTSVSTTNDVHSAKHRIETVERTGHHEFAQHRLDLIIECAAGAQGARDMQELADLMLNTAIAGTGFTRGAVVRQVSAGGDVETIAHVGHGRSRGHIDISRSLLAAASAGEVVRLTGEDESNFGGESIMQLGIHSAICAPLMLERSVEAYLYLDARKGERSMAADAAAFCRAIARIAEMALGNLRRRTLEVQRRSLEADMNAARQAQDLIMPPPVGSYGLVRYAMARKPGRFVAGDLFDIVGIGQGGSCAAFLGDVSGKGVGAGVLMAIAQTYLRLCLQAGSDLGSAVSSLNDHLLARTASGQFITLWLGLFDMERRQLQFVDAGHGHWLVCRPGARPETIRCKGGLIVGIQSGSYEAETLAIEPGTRVVVFSDGLVEQRNADGDEFGVERAKATLEGSQSAVEDVERLSSAILEFAQTDALSDDLTIASIEVGT
ncbi:MAG: SpoIIE family protein phosphatase [Phycisphaeraceae bacterium]|nr:SpoIIE family protein phosphatase [Phycisphaeraceae bacterium]MCW5761649.1 SpoIIE family protein phosphatase [Phycisphaeraceae bacterium]